MISIRTAFVVAATFLAVSNPASQTPELHTVPRPRTLALEPYVAEGVAETLLAGKVIVPENRADPKGRTITIHVIVVPALTKGAKDTPLFDLAGGPGLAASSAAGWYAADSTGYRATRDIVLVDQRGTGLSNPLRCPELERVSALDPLFDPAAVRRCRDELAKNADLTQYGTLPAVHDLEAVRRALAYEQIDLTGISYGTVVAQTYMREYPHNVRCAVLWGTVPLDEKLPLHFASAAEEVLQRIFDDCERDPQCFEAFPSLRSEWKDLLASFDQGPVRAIYSDTLDTRMIALERGPFCEGVRRSLGDAASQRRVPFAIHRAARGDFAPFFRLVSPDTVAIPYAEGMFFSVVCPEGTQRIADDEIDGETAATFLGRYRVDRQVAACDEWPTTALSEEALAPVAASVPTLLLAGGMDFVTPVAWAQRVSSRLSDSRVVVIDYLGHVPDGVANMECVDELIRAFLRAGTTVGLDISCVDSMLPPAFAIAPW